MSDSKNEYMFEMLELDAHSFKAMLNSSESIGAFENWKNAIQAVVDQRSLLASCDGDPVYVEAEARLQSLCDAVKKLWPIKIGDTLEGVEWLRRFDGGYRELQHKPCQMVVEKIDVWIDRNKPFWNCSIPSNSFIIEAIGTKYNKNGRKSNVEARFRDLFVVNDQKANEVFFNNSQNSFSTKIDNTKAAELYPKVLDAFNAFNIISEGFKAEQNQASVFVDRQLDNCFKDLRKFDFVYKIGQIIDGYVWFNNKGVPLYKPCRMEVKEVLPQSIIPKQCVAFNFVGVSIDDKTDSNYVVPAKKTILVRLI